MSSTTPPSLSSDLRRIPNCAVLDSATDLKRFSTDFGQLVHKRPAIVVRPGGATAVQRIVRYAADKGLRVTVRGAGQSLSGQSLAEGGIVLLTSGLSSIARIHTEEHWFEAEGGASYRQVVEATAGHEFVPTVLPSDTRASLSGTLSTVGWGAGSFRYGAQVDSCLALEVVTGSGELVRCSPEENADLFSHALGGLGQFGVITRARCRTRPFAPVLRTFSLAYPNLDSFLEDWDRAVEEGQATFLEGFITREFRGGHIGPWRYWLDLSVEAKAYEAISDEQVLDNLRFTANAGGSSIATVQYLTRRKPLHVEGAGIAQPWMTIFLPRSAARHYIEFCLENLPFPDLGARGAALRIWCGSRGSSPLPMVQLPAEQSFVLFSVLASMSGPRLPAARTLLAWASDLGVRLGGKRHLGSWLPFDANRWQLHFGDDWTRLHEAKRRYDPRGVLGADIGACALAVQPARLKA